MSAACVLYVAIDCDTVPDAEALLGRFIDAGLNTESSRVHVAVGEHDTLHERTPKP